MGSRVQLYADIRRDARVEELSIRELTRKYNVHRRTIRQALAVEQPPTAARKEQPAPPTTRSRRPPRVAGQQAACGWCGASVAVPARGRVPKWCSDTCRHRAWEQRRAAASGRSAVHVIDRTIETVKTVTVVQRERVEVPVLVQPRTAGEYAAVLAALAGRVDAGRIYQRDLPVITDAVNGLIEALHRRR
ncbi:hypothetical protein SAMN05421595_0705 [Austwickia chelonae]|uniref:Uncharacterized protein n=1 Tax=Austwickia chelonae NBRC 105200 TaxID=1184607 RepID=K6VN85_9MICO|nr:hypothetical protein [Austwickia chelonae]GAB78184.1 hypothetical protein AUCHE_08_04290 [Austwickia chelonae NBRC 105200]SEV98385.1 hypothetical protein SAMN05421595_0705 [Austwickia chelonae]